MASLIASNRMMSSAFCSNSLRRSQTQIIQRAHLSTLSSGLPEYVHRYEGPEGKQQQCLKLQRPKRIVLMAGLDGTTGPAVDALTRIKAELDNGELKVCALNARLDIVLGGPKPRDNTEPLLCTNLLGSTCAQEIMNESEEEKEEKEKNSDRIAENADSTTGYKSLDPILKESQILVTFETSKSSQAFVRVGGPGPPNLSDTKLATYFRDYDVESLRIPLVIDPEMNLWNGRVSTPDEYVRSCREMRPDVPKDEYDWEKKRATVVVDTGDDDNAESVTYSQLRVLLDHFLDVEMPDEIQNNYDNLFNRVVKKVPDNDGGGSLLLPPAFSSVFLIFSLQKPTLLAPDTEWKWDDFEAPANFLRCKFNSTCGSSRAIDKGNEVNRNQWIPLKMTRTSLMYAQSLKNLRENEPIFWGMKLLLIKFVGKIPKAFTMRRQEQEIGKSENIPKHLNAMNKFNQDFLTRVRGNTSFVKRDIKKEVYESTEKYPQEDEESMFRNSPSLGRMQRGVKFPATFEGSVGNVAEEINRYENRADTSRTPFKWSGMAMKHFIYCRKPNDPKCRPVVVYPSMYRTQDAFSAKMEPPYKSARVTFYFPLERAIQKSMLYLGVTRPPATAAAIGPDGKAIASPLPDAISRLLRSAEEYNSGDVDAKPTSRFKHKLRTLPDGRQVDYVGFVVGQECDVNFFSETGRPWVQVLGPNKDHVGEAYACLSEVLLCFSALHPEAENVYVQLPAFNRKTGDIMFYDSRQLTKNWD